MSVLSQPAYFAHANVFHHNGKPVPIELSIVAIPRDGSDPEIICITVNHTGQTSKAKDFRSNCQENACLRLVHHPLTKSVPVEYLPFCLFGSDLGQRGRVELFSRGSSFLSLSLGCLSSSKYGCVYFGFCRLHSSRRRVREMVYVVGRLGNERDDNVPWRMVGLQPW
ncbi:hypothetical protein TNCV_1347721 [Trichonephila clavipes]|nr:hypothetical protein TNCV_1347721 [Trichonephila clavipes]